MSPDLKQDLGDVTVPLKLLMQLREFIIDTHDFRYLKDEAVEEGEMPFGVIDYYGMEDLVKGIDEALGRDAGEKK